METRKDFVKVPIWWNIFIIDVDNHGKKFYKTPHKRMYYTGLTHNIGKRIGDFLTNRGYGFMNTQARHASKKLVYVEYLYGTEFDAKKRKWQIKKMSRLMKEKMIVSAENQLVQYVPLKAIVLKKNQHPDEHIAMKVY